MYSREIHTCMYPNLLGEEGNQREESAHIIRKSCSMHGFDIEKNLFLHNASKMQG